MFVAIDLKLKMITHYQFVSLKHIKYINISTFGKHKINELLIIFVILNVINSGMIILV